MRACEKSIVGEAALAARTRCVEEKREKPSISVEHGHAAAVVVVAGAEGVDLFAAKLMCLLTLRGHYSRSLGKSVVQHERIVYLAQGEKFSARFPTGPRLEGHT